MPALSVIESVIVFSVSVEANVIGKLHPADSTVLAASLHVTDLTLLVLSLAIPETVKVSPNTVLT